MRLAEAEALLDAGLPSGAYYLAGYAVECGLKACIAKRTQRHDFPDKREVDASWTHNLRVLVEAAKLESAHRHHLSTSPGFRRNWERVKLWSEQSRYESKAPEEARALVEAVGSRRGVLAWIKHHW